MTSADVDVVIPCWGSYSTSLASCIRSAVDAGNVIVVGDDAAAAVARAEGVRFLPGAPPLTVGAARHVGMLASAAAAICFLDADDRLLPGALHLMSAYLERDSAAVAVAGKMARRDTTGSWPPVRRARLACTRPGSVVLLWRNSLPAVGSCLIRRRAIGDARLFPDLADEDWHAAITLRTLGRVVFLDVALLDYAIDDGSLSRRSRDLGALERSQALLLATARTHLRTGRWWWSLVDRVAAPLRWQHRLRTVSRWSAVSPR